MFQLLPTLFAFIAIVFPLAIAAQRATPIPPYGKPLKCSSPVAAIAPSSPDHHLIIKGAAGAGTQSNPWTNWEDKVNAMPENSLLEFQVGWYARSKTIAVQRGWKIHGKGIGLSNIVSARSATKVAFMANYPGNCSTAVNNVIQHLSILDNGQGGDVAYADVGGTFVDVNHVRMLGFKFGLILDQSEVVTVQTNIFDEQLLGCLWVVNGDDFTPGNKKGFTNVIHATNANQFNPLPTGIGIIYDGGYTFSDVGNNHNGGKHYVYIAGAQTATIALCEMEGAASDGIVTGYETYFGKQGVGANFQLAIRDNVIVTPNAYCIRNGYFGLLENNLLSSKMASILCGNGVPGAQVQINNLNSYSGVLNSCTNNENAFLHLNSLDKQIAWGNKTTLRPTPDQARTITARLDFGVVPPSSCEERQVGGFTNLKPTDFVQVALPPELAAGDNTSFNWYVRDTTTVVIRRCNLARTQATQDPPAVAVRVKVDP